MSQHSVIFI